VCNFFLARGLSLCLYDLEFLIKGFKLLIGHFNFKNRSIDGYLNPPMLVCAVNRSSIIRAHF
jgi:hypothetical protein